MRIDLWRRFQSYQQRSDISRQESDGQPLIHHVPPATEPPAVSTKSRDNSGIRDVFRKPVRSGSYILLDDKSRDDSGSLNSTQYDGHRNGLTSWVSRHKLFLGCLLPLFSVLFELTLLSLFLYIYLSLPKDPKTGARLRLSSQYSMWPFIACVGSTKLSVFRALSIAIVACSLTAVLLSFYLNYKIKPGYWLRRVQLLQTLSANGLLIWLTFAAKNTDSQLHLYIVSVRLLLLFGGKCTSWLVAFAMLTAYPHLKDDTAWKTSFKLKMIVMPFAFVMATLANAGVFACRRAAAIQQEGSTCYNLVAAAGISDWLYTGANIVFLGVMAYDLYYDEHFGKVSKGEPTPRPSWE